MIKANNPNLKSWLEVEKSSDFPIQNLPFGIFKTADLPPRSSVRIGNFVVDLAALAELGYFHEMDLDQSVFSKEFLNDFIFLGKQTTRDVRNLLSDLLNAENHKLHDNTEHKENVLHKIEDVEMLLPMKPGDYTDYYSSEQHAFNVGSMFRDPNNALLPNWKHIPVGYHGRSSSIIVSGTPIHRPKGQTRPSDNEPPVFGPTKLLDFELEMALITHQGKPLGESISIQEADDYMFGMVLFNDWSARDIQKWEYVPLGPFLAKNFASSTSPWIVTLDALEPFRVKGPQQDPPVLPYLKYEGNKHYSINLEVQIQPENSEPKSVCLSNFKHMYWNMAQQLAHHTVNGCNMNAGDMLASGTISGPTPDSFGSMLEIAWRGTKPVKMPDGTERKFINDNDTVIMKGWCEKDGVRIGFGEVSTKVLPVFQ